jgi:glutamate dehydrogenase
MPTTRQYELLISLEKALAGLCRQVVEQGLPIDLDKKSVKKYRQRLGTFRTHLGELLPAEEWRLCKEVADVLVGEGFPDEMALEMAGLRYLVGFLPAVYIAEATGADLLEVTTAMGQMRLRLKLAVVMESLNEFPSHDRWDRMALTTLRSAFIKQAVKLTRIVVAEGKGAGSFLADRRQRLDYYLGLVETLRSAPPISTSPYMVLLRALEAVDD